MLTQWVGRTGPWEEVMKMHIHVALIALLGMLGVMVPATPSRAETGTVAVVFNKGGFIVRVGGGEACWSSGASAIRSPYRA
jgi:hypothetical protein